MPSLLDLSAELKLTIIEQLKADEELEEAIEALKSDDERREEEHPERPKDWPILNLSNTCKLLRVVCAPFIFKSLILVNNEKSATSIQSIANSTSADLIRKLHFKGSTPGDFSDSPAAPSDKDFPPTVNSILENLKAFPNLEHLVIQLPADSDNFDLFPDEDIEDWNGVLGQEEAKNWRALNKKTYAAIAHNFDHGSLKHLELVNMVAREASSWQDECFRKLLARLDCFTVSLMGGDNGAGWCMNTNGWYGDFINRMSGFFFDHLKQVKQISLTATEDGPIGLEGYRHAPSPLHTQLIMPLQSLFLKHNFISKSLADFIIGHGHILEHVHLHECYSGENCSLTENGISWSQFLSLIERARPTALLSFEITPIHAGTDEDLAPVRKQLDDDPEKRVFAYNILDDKYGMLFNDDEGWVEAFEKGEDQAAFDKLQEVVACNLNKQSEK